MDLNQTFHTYLPMEEVDLNAKTFSLSGKLKARDAAYKHGKVSGDNCMVKQYKYGLRRSIKMARQKWRINSAGRILGVCGSGF